MINNNNGIGGKRGKLLLGVILMSTGAIGSVWAGETDYGVGYTAEHSDNISLAPANEKSDWIHSLIAGFAYRENTVDLVANVLALATYNKYQEDSFGDESLFDLISSAVWTISPQRFLWTVEDTYQQALVDSTGVDTPSNRTNVNVLSTGPDVYLRLAPVHTLAFGARAGYVYTGDVNADNRRLTGTAAWLYQSSPVTTLSLNYQGMNVEYDDPVVNNDFMSENVFLRADFRPSRSEYVLDVGQTHINFDRGNDVDGTLARFSWNRQSTPETSFGVSINKEFSDTGTDALASSTSTGAAVPATGQASVVTGDVYSTKGGFAYFTHRSSQFGLQFQAGKRKLDFETSLLDRKETYGRLEFDYFFRAETTATLYTDYTKTDYLDIIRHDTEQNSGVRLDHYLNRSLSLGLEARHNTRTSTLSLSEYTDNRFLISLLYTTGPLFAPLHRR